MNAADVAKILIGIGLLIIALSFIFAIANMTGLIKSKNPSQRSHIRLTGFNQESEFDSSFKRHGLAMIGMFVGMIFIAIAVYVGGIDIAKEILRQFGVDV